MLSKPESHTKKNNNSVLDSCDFCDGTSPSNEHIQLPFYPKKKRIQLSSVTLRWTTAITTLITIEWCNCLHWVGTNGIDQFLHWYMLFTFNLQCFCMLLLMLLFLSSTILEGFPPITYQKTQQNPHGFQPCFSYHFTSTYPTPSIYPIYWAIYLSM